MDLLTRHLPDLLVTNELGFHCTQEGQWQGGATTAGTKELDVELTVLTGADGKISAVRLCPGPQAGDGRADLG